MDTATRADRADRLHAMWQRRAARFQQAHYAYRLADEFLERLPRHHPDYINARSLANRAARPMDIINRQTRRLARLEIATVLGAARHAA